MAYSDVYRSQSQSSNPAMTAIDGIGMKINERLVPPPMITIPSEYQPGNPSEILFMEYDFSREEHVLRWSQQERDNQDAMRQAATQRVGDSIQTFSQTVELPDPTPTAIATTSSNGAEQTAAQDTAPAPPPAPGNPFINLGSTILTPMPIGPSHIRKPSGGNKNQTGLFDLTDFENEQDPFENMELKVLNDREELNKMIFEVQPLPPTTTASASAAVSDALNSNHTLAEGNNGQDAGRPSPPCTPVNLQDVDYPDVESLDSGQYPLQPQQPAVSHSYTAGQPQVVLQTSAHQAYYQPPQTAPAPSSLPYPTQGAGRDATFPFSQSMPLPPISNSQYLVQQTVSTGPNYMANSVPMSSIASSVVGGHSGTATVTLSSAGNVKYTPQLGDKGYLPYQNYYSRHSGSNHNTNTANGHLLTHPDSSQLPGAQGRQTPPLLNPLRSARSTPDISGSDERRLPPLLPSSHTPPPTSRPYSPNDISSSSSPPPRPSVNQVETELDDMNWNHYSILPSTPRSSTNSPTSAKSVSNAKPRLPNPFDGLPHDAQRYVESVTDMGFPRARVARAVQKLGNDDKKVIDHLCMVNRLTEQGHNGDDAEQALLLFDSNIEKAEQYLKLLSQFKEIGFIEDKIQEALVSTNLDENKTLDLLTAS